MASYFFKRILLAWLIIWGVLTVTFFILHLASGDPSTFYFNPEISEKAVANIRRQMGWERPLWQQYFLWLKEFASGNFGVSFVQKRPVNQILWETIPRTLLLTSVVFLVQLIFGVILGVTTALKRGSKFDTTVSASLLFMYSMPGFWLALIAILIFSLKLGWLPTGQMQSFADLHGFALLWDRIRHLILPATVLSIPFIAYTTRFVRGSVLEVLGQDYIRTALAYGIEKKRILYKYALKNALLPLATLLGLYLPFLMGGAVVIEYIFAWPGMGRLTVNAIFAHDFPIILASNFIAALTVVVGNLISDLLYALVDPKISMQTPA